MSLYVAAAPQVMGLDFYSQNVLNKAWTQWRRRLPRNFERLVYLDGKNKLKDLKIAIPPTLKDKLEVVMGWAEKAVSEPANRTVWDGVLGPDGQEDPMDISSILYPNNFDVEFPQGVRASMSYSCAFLTETAGAADEPSVVMMFHSAMYATGLWDRRRRALSAGLLINDLDDLGQPIRFTLMMADEIVICERGASWYVADRVKNTLNRIPMQVLPLNPDLDRPFGRARIDRQVMSLVDRAVRTEARLDVHSELYSAMKLILLGADENSFKGENGSKVPLWSWYMGRFNTLTRDEEGELPSLEKISAESPEPHIATMRQLASDFSGHTGVPLGSLGIAQANPESADAKNVAREDIVFMVERQHRVYGHAMKQAFENALMIRDHLSEPPAEVAKWQMLWRRPDRASQAAMADAGAKQVQAAGLEDTRVGMQLLGLTEQQIVQAESERNRRSALDLLSGFDDRAQRE